MSTTVILGFSGKKSSGKSTCVEQVRKIIQGRFPDKTIQLYAFADPLKKMCRKFFGLTYQQCYGTEEEKNTYTKILWENFPKYVVKDTNVCQSIASYLPRRFHGLLPSRKGEMTAREVLQFFGTEVFRAMYTNAHVDAMMSDIREDNADIALIQDVRFSNEVFSVLGSGGRVIRLTRSLPGRDEHTSETALDQENFEWKHFSAIMYNEKFTIEAQEDYLHTLLKEWEII
jgi:hypothetical protein